MVTRIYLKSLRTSGVYRDIKATCFFHLRVASLQFVPTHTPSPPLSQCILLATITRTYAIFLNNNNLLFNGTYSITGVQNEPGHEWNRSCLLYRLDLFGFSPPPPPPQLQIICCYIARYYIRNQHMHRRVIKDYVPPVEHTHPFCAHPLTEHVSLHSKLIYMGGPLSLGKKLSKVLKPRKFWVYFVPAPSVFYAPCQATMYCYIAIYYVQNQQKYHVRLRVVRDIESFPSAPSAWWVHILFANPGRTCHSFK